MENNSNKIKGLYPEQNFIITIPNNGEMEYIQENKKYIIKNRSLQISIGQLLGFNDLKIQKELLTIPVFPFEDISNNKLTDLVYNKNHCDWLNGLCDRYKIQIQIYSHFNGCLKLVSVFGICYIEKPILCIFNFGNHFEAMVKDKYQNSVYYDLSKLSDNEIKTNINKIENISKQNNKLSIKNLLIEQQYIEEKYFTELMILENNFINDKNKLIQKFRNDIKELHKRLE